MSNHTETDASLTVTVKYFASLRERMGVSEQRLDAPAPLSVAQVWCRVSGEAQVPENLRAAVNLEYVDPAHQVADGDEIAFFPPVTGG